MASLSIIAANKAELDRGDLTSTTHPGIACSRLPPHWRTNKSLPEPFRIASVGPDIPNGTEVSVSAANENVSHAELKNFQAVFHNNVARFSDLRFIGKSGRGTQFNVTMTIGTHPPLIAVYEQAIKVTVDGPRSARTREKGDVSDDESLGPERVQRKDARSRPYGTPQRRAHGGETQAMEPYYDEDPPRPSWPVLDSFIFEDLSPSAGREGDACTCVLRFGKVDKDVNIGFGLLFGAAVPVFDEDMETEIDRVRIRFRIPSKLEAIGDPSSDSDTIEVMALFKRGSYTFQADRRMVFRYVSEPLPVMPQPAPVFFNPTDFGSPSFFLPMTTSAGTMMLPPLPALPQLSILSNMPLMTSLGALSGMPLGSSLPPPPSPPMSKVEPHPPPLVRRSSVVAVKRRLTERSISRKDLRSAEQDSKKAEHAKLLEEARKVPMDVLAKEWLDSVDAPIEMRVYLVEKLLPTLVLAIEKLLREVSAKGLVDQAAPTPALNPINYLAQYLLRNNPRFSNFAEASPYNKSMRLVQQELKDRAYEMSGTRLAKIAADIERRRKLVEEEAARRAAEWRVKLQPIVSAYAEWDEAGFGLHAPMLIESLQAFHQSKIQAALELPASAVNMLKFTELPRVSKDLSVPVTLDNLVCELGPQLEDAPQSVVEALALHLNSAFGHESFADTTFQALFDALPEPPDRQRLLRVLQDFYEGNKDPAVTLTRPRAQSFNTDGSGTSTPTRGSLADITPMTFKPNESRKSRFAHFFPRAVTNLFVPPASSSRTEFVDALNELIGSDATEELVTRLAGFVRKGLDESPEQRAERIEAEQKRAEEAELHNTVSQLFDKWDNDCTGFLDTAELSLVFRLWKQSTEEEAAALAQEALNFVFASNGRMRKSEFTKYALECLLPRETNNDKSKLAEVIASLNSCLQFSFLEEARGKMRKGWMQGIRDVDSNPSAMTDPRPVIAKVFEVIREDGRLYGNEGVVLSASVSDASGNGTDITQLRFISATQEDEEYVVGKTLAWTETDGVSFSAVDEGMPIVVSSILKHGHVRLFRDRQVTEETDGSLVVFPLRDKSNHKVKNGVLGTLNIDTLAGQNCGTFEKHQISFHQGVANAIADTIKRTKAAEQFAKIAADAVQWLPKLSIETKGFNVYFVSKLKSGAAIRRFDPKADGLSVNVTRGSEGAEHLFRCVEMDQPSTSFIKPFRHTCFPIHLFARTYALLDIATDQKLNTTEEREVLRVSKVLAHIAQYLVEMDVPQGERRKEKFADWHSVILDIDEFDQPTGMEVFFARALLMDTRLRIGKLDSSSFKPLRDQLTVAPVSHRIIKALLTIFLEDESIANDWSASRHYLSTHLSRLIIGFDPTTVDSVESLQSVAPLLADLTYEKVLKSKSTPIVVIYNWFLVANALAAAAASNVRRRPRLRVRSMSVRSGPSDGLSPAASPRLPRSSLAVVHTFSPSPSVNGAPSPLSKARIEPDSEGLGMQHAQAATDQDESFKRASAETAEP